MTRPLLYVLLGVASLATAFAFGRYSRPASVETHTEYVDRLQVVRTVVVQRVTDVKWKRVVVTQPDGSSHSEETSETHSEEKSNENVKSDEIAKSDSTSKEVSSNRPDWQISALVGLDVTTTLNGSGPLKLTFGAHVQRRILGPVSVGVFGLSSGTVGLSAGVQF